MSPALQDYITATIVEKEIIDVDFVEKEIVTCELHSIDILNYLQRTVVSGLINEVPTRLSFVRFQTTKAFVTGSLVFYLNGLKEQKADLTEINSTIFEITEAIQLDDDVEIEYLELI